MQKAPLCEGVFYNLYGGVSALVVGVGVEFCFGLALVVGVGYRPLPNIIHLSPFSFSWKKEKRSQKENSIQGREDPPLKISPRIYAVRNGGCQSLMGICTGVARELLTHLAEGGDSLSLFFCFGLQTTSLLGSGIGVSWLGWGFAYQFIVLFMAVGGVRLSVYSFVHGCG